jgi:hypothetical protein
MKNKLFLLGLSILLIDVSYAQSLSVRAYYGRKFYNSGKRNIVEGNFDETYSNTIKSSRYLFGLGIEYQLKTTNSIELKFTSLQITDRFYSAYKVAGSFEYISLKSYNQIQCIYNKQLYKRISLSKKLSLMPIASIGIGFGFVYDPTKFDDDKYYAIIYGPNGNNFETTINTYRRSSINYSLIGRIGFAIKHKNKERLRVLTAYNLGINKPIYQEIKYSHGNEKYGGKVSYGGSNFNITISYPIILFKKK